VDDALAAEAVEEQAGAASRPRRSSAMACAAEVTSFSGTPSGDAYTNSTSASDG